MYEKVNPAHPDKLADRIAGALVDMAYEAKGLPIKSGKYNEADWNSKEEPKIAVEVLLGHGKCHIIAETSVKLDTNKVNEAVYRICKSEAIKVIYDEVPQDVHLAANQDGKMRCGDNGIFKGVPVANEQRELSRLARAIYKCCPYDGKYIIDGGKLIICQSNCDTNELKATFPDATVNPLGDWTGGIDVDTGATNRKLGSDMADSVTGGGLHGKDFSKADVSANIYMWLKAQKEGETFVTSCAIGDECVDGEPYYEVVHTAREYVVSKGGFEKFAEWGLI